MLNSLLVAQKKHQELEQNKPSVRDGVDVAKHKTIGNIVPFWPQTNCVTSYADGSLACLPCVWASVSFSFMFWLTFVENAIHKQLC